MFPRQYLSVSPPGRVRQRVLLNISAIIIIALGSCASSSGVYKPPRLGAEYRFEDGLKRQKHPQNLFSKKMQKDLEKQGKISTTVRDAPPPPAGMVKGSKGTDTLHTLQHAAMPDSLQTLPKDTLGGSRPVPATDTLRPATPATPKDTLTQVP